MARRLPAGIEARKGAKGVRYVGRVRQPNGRWTYRALGGNLVVAKQVYAEILRNQRRAELGLEDEIRQGVSVRDVVDRYISHLRETGKTAGSIKNVDLARRICVPELERMGASLVHQVRRETLAKLRDRILVGERGNRSPTYRNCLVRSITAAIGWAEGAGVIARAPFTRGPKALEVHDADRVWLRRRLSFAEAAKLQEAADAQSISVGVAVAIGFGSGLRIGEIIALRWEDYADGQVTVRPGNSSATGSTNSSRSSEHEA